LKRTASLGSYTRSAARGTFSAYRSIPIRWRLAGGSAALTFVILLVFAVWVGARAGVEVTDSFQQQTYSEAQKLAKDLGPLGFGTRSDELACDASVNLGQFASGEAQIRIFDSSGNVLCTQNGPVTPAQAARVTPPFPPPQDTATRDELGYRVVVSRLRSSVSPKSHYFLLYAKPLSDIEHTLAEIRFFLLLGVVGGTILALLAGLATAARATRPIVQLTEAAREIERTRDPSRHVPMPEAEDEIAELARTLEGMLGALDASRKETEAALQRQREFVADASHELRTPLTSVLANLELLTEELEGDQAESARAALRSTRRMRRLVGDLLLLARADAKREQRVRATDLAEVLLEAASELGPMSDEHDLVIDAHRAIVGGIRDDLHRLALNLLENAIRHTPPGTQVRAHTGEHGDRALLIVEDDGPGIPPPLADRVFERFVRGGGDGARGSGLGLAIVRAVAESHGGRVLLEPIRPGDPLHPGTRFVIDLPLAQKAPGAPAPVTLEGAPGS
jgi:two-component system OmpR family sensor kinase